MKTRITITGYVRPNRTIGIRNHIVIVPSVFCCNRIVQEIAGAYGPFGDHKENRVIPLTHSFGCCNAAIDREISLRVLANTLKNPNVGAFLVVSLGCGQVCSSNGGSEHDTLWKRVSRDPSKPDPRTGVLSDEVVVQGNDFAQIKEISHKIIQGFMAHLKGEDKTRRATTPGKLVVGVMNGGSDPTSGLFSNPAVGHFSDWIIAQGGRVVFSQTTETLGGEAAMLERISPRKLRNFKMKRRLERLWWDAKVMRRAMEIVKSGESEPTPGNRRNGISTIEEKSVGSLFKFGHKKDLRLIDLLEHGAQISSSRGIHFVDGPGQDVLCLSGLVAAGAHLILFTTGLGTPTGSGLVPTIKITANPDTYAQMRDTIDCYLDVGALFADQAPLSLQDIALNSLIPVVERVVNGGLTAAEKNRQSDFQLRQVWSVE